jgi:hypothetical protein
MISSLDANAEDCKLNRRFYAFDGDANDQRRFAVCDILRLSACCPAGCRLTARARASRGGPNRDAVKSGSATGRGEHRLLGSEPRS